MARPGRPPINRENKILAEMSEDEKRLEVMIGEKLRNSERSPVRMTFEAACVLYTLECGSEYQKARCKPIIRQLLKFARLNGPHGRWTSDHDFLTCFIRKHNPGWKWREEIDDGSHENANERLAKLTAESERSFKAIRNRFVSPGAPDSGMLLRLLRMRPNDPTTCPTLRELKLATGLPERTIRRIIANLRPEPGQAEIVTIPLRHIFSRCGAMPRRYSARLVVGVLNEFVNRLPEFPIANEDQKRLRKIVTRVKKALSRRSSRSRSST
jgi:hypothetical protein